VAKALFKMEGPPVPGAQQKTKARFCICCFNTATNKETKEKVGTI